MKSVSLAATSATMNKLIFILFCGTAIFAEMPTADANTVIALYSRQGEGSQDQHFQYEHHGNNVSRAAVEKLTLEGVSASKTYSSVLPAWGAPRYRNSSTDIAGTDSRRVIRIVAR